MSAQTVTGVNGRGLRERGGGLLLSDVRALTAAAMSHRALLPQARLSAMPTRVSVTLSRVSAVETEAPVNLTFELADAGGDETGHNALLTWKYPQPGDLQYGWITLVYELQYRRVSDADNWKVRSADAAGASRAAPPRG